MALSVSTRRLLKRPTTGSQRITKYQRRRTLLVVIILSTVLGLLLMALGFLYTWLTSNQIMPNDAFNTALQKPVEIKKPVARLNQRVNVAVSSLSSPLVAGETAQLSIRTNVDAICTIEVLAPTQKLTSTDLNAKAADEFGIISWSWQVPTTAKNTSWPITVSCNNKEHSGVVKTALVIRAAS